MNPLDKIDTSTELHGIWESECLGKVKYPSRAAAEFVKRYNRRTFGSRSRAAAMDDGLEAYHCRFCGNWHLGH